MMKKFIIWLFNIKPEVKEVTRTIEVEKELPNGCILIEADEVSFEDFVMGVE